MAAALNRRAVHGNCEAPHRNSDESYCIGIEMNRTTAEQHCQEMEKRSIEELRKRTEMICHGKVLRRLGTQRKSWVWIRGATEKLSEDRMSRGDE